MHQYQTQSQDLALEGAGDRGLCLLVSLAVRSLSLLVHTCPTGHPGFAVGDWAVGWGSWIGLSNPFLYFLRHNAAIYYYKRGFVPACMYPRSVIQRTLGYRTAVVRVAHKCQGRISQSGDQSGSGPNDVRPHTISLLLTTWSRSLSLIVPRDG